MVVNQNSFIPGRPFFANKNFTFAKFSQTPCLSFAGPMLANNPYEDSFTTCQITPENHGSLLGSLLNMQLASRNPFSGQLLWVWCHQTDPFTTLPGWNHHMQLQNHIGRSRRGLFGFYVSCLWTTIPEGPLLSLAIEATHDKTDSTPALHFVFALRVA